MKISIASDHAGYNLKKDVVNWLKDKNYSIMDFGTYSEESVDYPDFAVPAAEAVSNKEADFGIVICGTGIGVSISANKVPGIRAANCCTAEMAKMARLHNDANVVAFGARLIDFDLAKSIVSTFLETEFEGGRHIKRVNKIHNISGI